jgi:protein DGCR14
VNAWYLAVYLLLFQEMGRIIQRDFFPDLEKLRAQNAYLEAVERNDVEKLREIYAKYSSGKRPPTERCKYNEQRS